MRLTIIAAIAFLATSPAYAISWELDPKNDPNRNAYERQQDEYRYRNHDTQKYGPLPERLEREERQRQLTEPRPDTYGRTYQDTSQPYPGSPGYDRYPYGQ